MLFRSDRFRTVLLPKNLWRMHGLRPANQPQRRLALAAHWLAAKDFLPRLENWFASKPGRKIKHFLSAAAGL